MAEESTTTTTTQEAFPTLPAFTVSVQVQEMPHYGPGQRGVVALQRIPAHTKIWIWTDRVERVHYSKLHDYLETKTNDIQDKAKKRQAKRVLLRQGFVLPNTTSSSWDNRTTTGDDDDDDDDTTMNEDYFCSNPTDTGRFMNHSSDPNCGPNGTLRDIQPGEEMTMDYHFHGNPQWYQAICREFDVPTEQDVAHGATR